MSTARRSNAVASTCLSSLNDTSLQPFPSRSSKSAEIISLIINNSASTKCKLYVPWEANYDDFRAESIWNTDAFYSIAHSSYAWDIYMDDGTMAVVTKPSTSTSEDHECTIIFS